MKLVMPEGSEDLEKLISSGLDSRKGIDVRKLWETPSMTQLLVFVRTSEEPHYHRDHDLTFTVLRGEGELYLNGVREKLRRGDVALVPRGKVHFYRNLGDVSVLLATFSPAYDGRDSVRVEL